MLALYRGREVYHGSGREAHYRGTDVVVGTHENFLLTASVIPGKLGTWSSSAENVNGEEVLEV